MNGCDVINQQEDIDDESTSKGILSSDIPFIILLDLEPIRQFQALFILR
jgi:hypothetical protein